MFARGWIAGLAALSGVLAPPVAAVPISSLSDLIVFGDSSVDSGNLQDLLVTCCALDPVPASSGYLGGRATNGLTHADLLNQAIEGTNTVASSQSGDNYAFGAARASDNIAVSPPLTPDLIPDLAEQIDQYSLAAFGAADPNALYMISIGGNDAFDALILEEAFLDPASLIADAAAVVAASVLTLQGLGAEHILVIGVGDVGSPPLKNGSETEGRLISENVSAAIQAALPTNVLYFDTLSFFDLVNANPAAYGLPTGLLTETSCLGDLGPADPGSACDAYAFFDDVHPTAPILEVLGNELITFVPEPSTGVLVGLGCCGFAIGRRGSRRNRTV